MSSEDAFNVRTICLVLAIGIAMVVLACVAGNVVAGWSE